jgi:hypothetical protein
MAEIKEDGPLVVFCCCPMAPTAGQPTKKSGWFTKRTQNGNGRDRKAERAAKRAKTMAVPVPVDVD